MGPVCAYDALVIEMIAKPALPEMVQRYSLQAMCNALRVWINALLGVDLTAPCNVDKK